MKPNHARSQNNINLSRSNSLATYLSLSAGAGVVAAVNANGAIIMYNGPAVTVGPNHFLFWDPVTMTAGSDESGDNMFKLKVYDDINYVVGPAATGDIAGFWGQALGVVTSSAPARLGGGTTIGVESTWSVSLWAYMSRPSWTTDESPWATRQDGTRGYIPFCFYDTADTFYGWADITYNDGPTQTLVLNNFAYNDTPNAAITTPGASVPEPATVVSGILLLAMGGTKVLTARRRKRVNQA